MRKRRHSGTGGAAFKNFVKRRVFPLVLTLFLLSLWNLPVHGEETEDLRDFAGTDALYDAAPEELNRDALENVSRGGDYASFWNVVQEFFLSAFSIGLRDAVRLLAALGGMLLLGAVFRTVEKNLAGGGDLDKAFWLLYSLALVLVTQNALESTLSLVTDTLQSSCDFLLATLPVSGLLLTMNGEIGRAALQGVALQHGIGVVSVLNTHVMAPLFRVLLAMSLAGAVTGNDLSPFTAFLQRTLRRSCLFLFTMLFAVLTLQNALATASDTLAMRGVRFAAGTFVPVVGSVVGEASRALSAGITLIRKECGAATLLILGYLLLRPVVMIALQKFSLSAAEGIGGILGDKRSASFLHEIAGLWDLLQAMVLFQGCYFLFSIVLFLQGGTA